MENLKTLNRSEIESLGKVVNVTKPQIEKTPTVVIEETPKGTIETDNVKPKTKMSMKKTVKNTEPRVLKFLANRKPTKTMVIAKALGMSSKVSQKEYKLVANLLLRLNKNGILNKTKTGVYVLASKQPLVVQTEMKFSKPTEKSYALTQEQRMANMREAKRQKKIERDLGIFKVETISTDEKLTNLFRLKKEVGRAPSFYTRVNKEIERLLLGVRHKEPSLKVLNNTKPLATKQELKGFKLIKNYPNSPYPIGVVIPGSKELLKYPEFWQPQYNEVIDEKPNLLQKAKECIELAAKLIIEAQNN
jgi:hypothetical protein